MVRTLAPVFLSSLARSRVCVLLPDWSIPSMAIILPGKVVRILGFGLWIITIRNCLVESAARILVCDSVGLLR